MGKPYRHEAQRERTAETLVGSIRLQYQYVNCARCQGGSSPLDAALVLTARRKPLNVPKAAVQLTKEIPDETACELFEELTGRP